MRGHGKERPLRSFIMPNESFKWDFILEKYVREEEAERASAEAWQTEGIDGFDKDYIVTRKKRRTRDRYFY